MQRAAMLAPLRNRGNHGTIIDPHRSIATVHLSPVDVVLAVALAIVSSVTLASSVGPIGRLWTWAYVRLAGPLGFAGGVGERTFHASPFASFVLPYFNVQAPTPTVTQWWIAFVVTLLVLAASFLLPHAFLPLAYGLRLIVVVQSTALVFFGVAPARFPTNLPDYMTSMLAAGMGVLVIVPVMLALTFYIIDVGLPRKIILTVAVVGHLLVFIPLQYAVHAWLLVHGTLLVMPVLFMLFGLLPEVMILIAFYGWGMSWRPARARTSRE